MEGPPCLRTYLQNRTEFILRQIVRIASMLLHQRYGVAKHPEWLSIQIVRIASMLLYQRYGVAEHPEWLFIQVLSKQCTFRFIAMSATLFLFCLLY